MKHIITIIVIIIILASCKVVDITGTHKVTSAREMGKVQIVKLENLKKEFVFPTDTLKTGDFVNIKKY